jgi:hypothetical protein
MKAARHRVCWLLEDLIMTGEYQPAECKFNLSRRVLEVCLELS